MEIQSEINKREESQVTNTYGVPLVDGIYSHDEDHTGYWFEQCWPTPGIQVDALSI